MYIFSNYKHAPIAAVALFSTGTALICRKVAESIIENSGIILIAAAVCSILVAVTIFAEALKRFTMWVPWICAALAVAGSGFSGVVRGAILWCNATVATWNYYHDDGVCMIGINSFRSTDLIFFAMTLTCMLVGLFMVLTAGRWLISAWIEIMIITGYATVIGAVVPAALVLVIFSGVIFWLNHVNNVMTSGNAVTVCIILLVLILSAAAVQDGNLGLVTEVKSSAADKVDYWRYGSDTLPQGDIRLAGQLHKGDDETLEVSDSCREAVYFRGFVGSRYNDGQWEEPPGSAYGGDYAGILKWLQQKSFSVASQYDRYITLDKTSDNEGISVRNKGAYRKYLYLPYFAYGDIKGARFSQNQDMQYVSDSLRGSTEYSCKGTANELPTELTVVSDWVNSPDTYDREGYMETEQVYRSFVYDRYLELTDQQRSLMNSYFWREYDEAVESVYSATDRIRSVMSQRLQYEEFPEDVPADRDPVVWFLTEKRQGNAVHYASAAVMAYRAYGIPARYAEGYYQEPGTDGIVKMTNGDSHAWVEIYMDGMGWMPVDVTPGYYYDAVSLQSMINNPDNQIRTAKPDKEKNNNEAETGGSTGGDKKKENGLHFNMYVLIAVAILLGTAVISVMAIINIFGSFTTALGFVTYRRLNEDRKPDVIYNFLQKTLNSMDIPFKIGYNANMTEKLLIDRFNCFEAGEYLRINEILEIHYYSQRALSKGELRTLEAFCEKIWLDFSQKPRMRRKR